MNIANVRVIVEPPVEPVTLAEIYLFLHLDPDGSPPTHPDDEELLAAIIAARGEVEKVTRRSLVEQTLRLSLPSFPYSMIPFGASFTPGVFPDGDDFVWRERGIDLLRPPLIGSTVEQVRYYDLANALQTLAPASYYVSNEPVVPRLELADGYTWPQTFPGRKDAVQIDYVTGYPPEGSPPTSYVANIPKPLIQAVKFHVQLQYDTLTPEQRDAIEKTARRLTDGYKVNNF